MAVKNAIYQVDNGSGFDEIHFKTKAAQVLCENGNDVEVEISNNKVLRGVDGDYRWVKLPDGTLIQNRKISANVNINTAWGTGFTGVIPNNYGWPIAFSEVPTVLIHPQASVHDCWVSNIKDTQKHLVGAITLCRSTSATNAAVTLTVTGIGRWK